jgi:hypothetical protein
MTALKVVRPIDDDVSDAAIAWAEQAADCTRKLAGALRSGSGASTALLTAVREHVRASIELMKVLEPMIDAGEVS